MSFWIEICYWKINLPWISPPTIEILVKTMASSFSDANIKDRISSLASHSVQNGDWNAQHIENDTHKVTQWLASDCIESVSKAIHINILTHAQYKRIIKQNIMEGVWQVFFDLNQRWNRLKLDTFENGENDFSDMFRNGIKTLEKKRFCSWYEVHQTYYWLSYL